MKIFILPNTPSSVSQLSECCKELSLPHPVCWDRTMLDFTIKSLLHKTSSSVPPLEAIKSMDQPVILFANIPTPIIRKCISIYKSRKQWPIFGVITPLSLEMTLGRLLEHFFDDREKERRLQAVVLAKQHLTTRQ